MKSFFSLASLNNVNVHSVHGPRVASVSKKTALASAIGLIFWGPLAYAEIYTVLNTADSGQGSFRQAVLDANANAGDDIIIFSNTLTNASIAIDSQIEVTGNLSITGLGQDNLTLLHNADGEMLSLSMDTFTITDLAVHTEANATGPIINNETDFDSITVRRATFNNTADVAMNAAAIYSNTMDTNQGEISISNSALSGFLKGAVHSNHASIDISESTISGNSSEDDGGAIYSLAGAMSISDSTISGNSSEDDGGAIYSFEGAISISDSTISGNSSEGHGGAVNGGSDILISYSTISGNKSVRDGAAIYGYESNISISYSTISGNEGEENGGAIYGYSSNISISASVISGNESKRNGGAIFQINQDSKSDIDVQLTIDQSLFMNNTAAGQGGAIQSSESADGGTSITGTSFIGNKAQSGGAIYTGRDSEVLVIFNEILVNCTFWGNAAESGGAIYTSDFGSIIALNSTFLDNTATASGNELYINNNFTIINSIVSANAEQGGSDNIYGANNAVIKADYSLIGGSDNATIEALTSGFNILNAAPLMADLADNGGQRIGANSDQPILTLRPLEGSPVFDAGDSLEANSIIDLPETDQRGEGNPRLLDNAVDMGALETIPGNIPPVLNGMITDVNVIVGESVNVNLAAYFSDPEGAVLMYTASGLPSGFGVSFDGLLTGDLLATEAASLPVIVTLSVSDGEDTTDETFNITLNNQAPILESTIPAQVFTVGEMFRYDFSVHFSDLELQTLSYSIEGLPSSLVLSTEGELTGSLNVSDATTVPETYTLYVTDGEFTINQMFNTSVVIPETPNSSSGSSGGGAFGFGWLFVFLGLGVFGRKRS